MSEQEIDQLITDAGVVGRVDVGLEYLAAKLDHLLNTLRVSGRLSRLSRDQVVTILYALRASGHDEVPPLEYVSYNQDGLTSVHNADFMREARFLDAYRRGVEAAGTDYLWHWRVRVGLWAAAHASRLPGDFVGCGVNRCA